MKAPKDKEARKIYHRCEKKMKEIVRRRDGPGCMVQKMRPDIKFNHTDVYQADHWISRRNAHLYFDIRNLTQVCSGCNKAKCFHYKPIEMAIDDIVRGREGEEAVKEMLGKTGPNRDWNRIYYLEKIEKQLDDILQDMDAIGGTE